MSDTIERPDLMSDAEYAPIRRRVGSWLWPADAERPDPQREADLRAFLDAHGARNLWAAGRSLIEQFLTSRRIPE